MKIAYLMNAPIPSKRANSVHVMKMCQAFKKRGVDITLYCEKGIEADYDEQIFLKYGVDFKFPIVAIENKHIFNNKMRIILSAFRMARIIKKRNFDYLYGRSLMGLYLLRKTRKFIYESHVPPVNNLFKYMEGELLKQDNCIKFIVISEALRKEYLRIFPWADQNKFEVLHDGADEVSKHIVEVVSLDNTQNKNTNVVIGYLGHLYPGKCMEVLIQIAKEKAELYFHVVGGTDEWVNHWREIIQKNQLVNIKLYGYIDNSEIGKYYNAFDICILPFSKDIFYSKKKNTNIGSWISPLKLFEAMAYGKAIIASSLPTIQEVLIDEETALLADPDDLEEWVMKLDRLIMDEELRCNLGKNAKKEFLGYYTWDRRAQNILDILHNKKMDVSNND